MPCDISIVAISATAYWAFATAKERWKREMGRERGKVRQIKQKRNDREKRRNGNKRKRIISQREGLIKGMKSR